MNITQHLEDNSIVINRNAIGWDVETGHAAVYDPASDDMINWVKKSLRNSLPKSYRNFLVEINGLYYKTLILYGIPPSLYKGKGLNRSILEPMNIIEAQYWETNVELNKNECSIGYIEGYEKNSDLIMNEKGNVRQCLNGCIYFTNLDEFLIDFIKKNA